MQSSNRDPRYLVSISGRNAPIGLLPNHGILPAPDAPPVLCLLATRGMTGNGYYFAERLFSGFIGHVLELMDLDRILGMVALPSMQRQDQQAILASAPFMTQHPELALPNTWQMWMQAVYLYLVCRSYEERWQPPVRTTTPMRFVASIRRLMGWLLHIIRAEGSTERPTYWGCFLLSAQRTAEVVFRVHHGHPLDCNLWSLYYCNVRNIPYDRLPAANVPFAPAE